MADFKKLLVWQRAHALNLRVAELSMSIRGAHFVSLRSQMVRAALSIPSNIVEGRGQRTDRQFAAFLRIALNSSSELEYHLITARDMGQLTVGHFDRLAAEISEIRQMLYGLLRSLDVSGTTRSNLP